MNFVEATNDTPDTPCWINLDLVVQMTRYPNGTPKAPRGFTRLTILDLGLASFILDVLEPPEVLLSRAEERKGIIEELHAELRKQWEHNHAEHCGCNLATDGECNWPPPTALLNKGKEGRS